MSFKYNGWNSYCFFLSAETTQAFLKNCYQRLQVDKPDQKSYENCYPFIYYLEHGQIYYQQASRSPLLLQPILLFYGFVHLIKACILTTDPNYPETTSVLAHGVSTRKRKKQHYNFFHDEVKFQKSGLFPFMAERMFHKKRFPGEKATMEELLKHIPELTDLFYQLERKNTFMKINHTKNIFSFPRTILDIFHMTEDRFKDYYISKSIVPVSFDDSVKDFISMTVENNKTKELTPLKFNFVDNEYVLPLSKGDLQTFPELLLHYLLLYNLSMIARYETEWWSELLKMMPNKDFPFIKLFLNITLEKGPFLIYEFLYSQS